MNAAQWLITGLVILIAGSGVLLFAANSRGLPAPRLLHQSDAGETTLSARGPLELVFSQPMDPQSVQNRLTLEPSIPGRYTWDAANKEITFWPESPLQPGQRYRLHLSAGARAVSGSQIREEQTWVVVARQPQVLYLSPSRAPELWRVPVDSVGPIRLTLTGGNVYDYAVSPDGEQVIFSARNAEKGYDLWETDREGGQSKQILPCGADWCVNPTYSADGQQVAYSRRVASGLAGAGPGMPRLWLLDRQANHTSPVYGDAKIGGAFPDWSPLGDRLAYFDAGDKSVRVLDFVSKKDQQFLAGAGASFAWSPDGSRLYFTQAGSNGEQPYVTIQVWDSATGQVHQWLGDEDIDYSAPEFSPDGSWAAVGERSVLGPPGKQITLVRADGNQPQSITDDPLSNSAGYHWDISGRLLVYQQLSLGSSGSLPSVVLWDRSTNQARTVAGDAFQPDWIP